MGMGYYRFRFDERPAEPELRRRLAREVGRSNSRGVDLEWSEAPGGGGVLGLLSQDAIALVYAAKVATALGGERLPFGSDRDDVRPLPQWTATPWIELPWLTRAKLWLGPTRM